MTLSPASIFIIRLISEAKEDKLEYLHDGKRHLICHPYSEDNLHRMAGELGIKRHWFHKGDKPHYDIPIKRRSEIEGKARLVSSKHIVDTIRKHQGEE